MRGRVIRIPPPRDEKELFHLCTCGKGGKSRKNPWDTYHDLNCPYLKASNERNEKRVREVSTR